MSLETDIRAMRPAFDRAMTDADDAISTPRVAPPVHDPWSRARLAVVAFAAVAVLAGAVGLVARLGSSSHHGAGIATSPPTTVAAVTTVPAPPPSTATTTTVPPTTTTQAGVPLTAVDWAAVDYPIACGTVFTPPVTVDHVVDATPAVGVDVAIVEVSCTHGAGTPPVAVFEYDGAASATAPHLAATLITISDGWQANGFTADGASVSLPVYGFSSASIANCCPDVHATLVWQWTGGRYNLVTSVPPHEPGPSGGQ